MGRSWVGWRGVNEWVGGRMGGGWRAWGLDRWAIVWLGRARVGMGLGWCVGVLVCWRLVGIDWVSRWFGLGGVG